MQSQITQTGHKFTMQRTCLRVPGLFFWRAHFEAAMMGGEGFLKREAEDVAASASRSRKIRFAGAY